MVSKHLDYTSSSHIFSSCKNYKHLYYCPKKCLPSGVRYWIYYFFMCTMSTLWFTIDESKLVLFLPFFYPHTRLFGLFTKLLKMHVWLSRAMLNKFDRWKCRATINVNQSIGPGYAEHLSIHTIFITILTKKLTKFWGKYWCPHQQSYETLPVLQ